MTLTGFDEHRRYGAAAPEPGTPAGHSARFVTVLERTTGRNLGGDIDLTPRYGGAVSPRGGRSSPANRPDGMRDLGELVEDPSGRRI